MLKKEFESDIRVGNGQWTYSELTKIIQDKIHQRLSRATTEYQDAYKIFGRPIAGVTPHKFRKQLEQWEIYLSSHETRHLFKYVGIPVTGAITFEYLVMKFMNSSPSNLQSWDTISAVNNHNKKISLDQASLNAAHFPPSMHQFRWSIDEIERRIQDKICERTANATVEKQNAFKRFGCPSRGINKMHFKKQLEKFGLLLTDEEITKLYNRYDTDGSGDLTFQEFMQGLMPQDYGAKGQSNAYSFNCPQKNYCEVKNTTPRRKPLTVAEMEKMLQEKLRSRTSNPNVEIQDTYKLFGRPKGGITLSIFIDNLNKFGMDLTNEEANLLFNKYDNDGNLHDK